uniref:UDP-glucose 4-epimerase n=1 Tax=Paulinella chromatophora TaxID=39717 RepID=B1X4P9_PAUCH|nr:UDP-glucose-4-epimerase [Paulinella chromatophora]ACB42918.1 UDP-glucose-4-epimerase [Paulinella chromatophora]
MANLLITGGAGFIGSHTCLVFLEAGHELIVIDNFINSSPEAIKRVVQLADAHHRLTLVEGDICVEADVEKAFTSFRRKNFLFHSSIDAVIHFAGLKAVGESRTNPLDYWGVNVNGSYTLLKVMAAHGCRTIVFSSSATLYGYPQRVPIPEDAPIAPINPYGQSKAAVEQLLADLAASETGWRIARLRYFNPVGAHPSGMIGEDPCGIPNNLFPFISQVAAGRRINLKVFGNDWPTFDGTAIRDYIHVLDLAAGHLITLETLLSEKPQMLTLNLGSGVGLSVLEVVAEFEAVCGQPIPYEIVTRRFGDAAKTVADSSLAETRIGWRTTRNLTEMCRDGWAWQSANPYGYAN